ncbi:MAG: molybdopterin dehydrogenase [Rhodospirillales bacterium]|nr:molybdopterin dehydrogenase [Rhodospirillales bacterium]
MKPPVFAYHDPRSVEEAVGLLGRLENTRLLAGGQSLMPMLNMRFVFPDHVIDLNRIETLAGIVQDAETIRIGAMTRQRDIADSALVRDRLPLLTEALAHVGHRQTRNRGTIGGSLCHLDPAAELVAAAANLDATIEIAGPDGVRTLSMAAFPRGFMTPAIEPDEMVTAVRMPLPQRGHGFSFMEFARRHGDFAIVSVAVLLVLAPDRRIARASITLGGVGAVPLRMVEAEALLVGHEPGAALFERAAETCRAIDALEDAQVPGWYRRQLAGVLMARALATARARAEGVST